MASESRKMFSPAAYSRISKAVRLAENWSTHGFPEQEQLPDDDIPDCIVRVTGSPVTMTTTLAPGATTTPGPGTTTIGGTTTPGPGTTTTTESSKVYPGVLVWRDMGKVLPDTISMRWPPLGDALYVESINNKSLVVGGQYHGWFSGYYDGRAVVSVNDGPCVWPTPPENYTCEFSCRMTFVERDCDVDGNKVKRTHLIDLPEGFRLCSSDWVVDNDPPPTGPATTTTTTTTTVP